jgi:transcriptional regulator with GAF, ATPase, and Fis domain
MSSAITWGPERHSSSDSVSASIHLQEAAFDNRIETLREIALVFLSELESLRGARPGRVEGSVTLCDEVQRFEIDLIQSALERAHGNQTRAARLLGVKPTTLNAKLKRYKIPLAGRKGKAEQDVHRREMAA